ncbi:TlpA family protein disulfide reductase [Williamwhitmania taraxaci]|uniref:Thioredoxin-like n=1 Tax=Williamwhitmania taraxaci TaxID=1640674 RepID=A0A1G6H385_9BACT|nr:TlpA disulfide reductase family protein [Williamwhitmania taraxaci]SDB88614.1 Thioredoxin-like [Williamwhitmania taraxaci]
MIRLITIGFFLQFSAFCALGQTITFTVKESPIPKAYLFLNHGNNTERVDSAMLEDGGRYVFTENKNRVSGEYTLSLPGKGEIKFIYAGTDVDAIGNFKNLEESIEYLTSDDNQAYGAFLMAKKLYEKKKELLEKIEVLYPDSSLQRKIFRKEIKTAEQEFWLGSQQIAKNNPTLLASTIIKATIGKKSADKITSEAAATWTKEHFWDGINLSDPRLEFTEIGGSLIWNYLELYFDNSLNKEDQETEFKKALNRSFGRSDIAENLVIFWANELFKVFSETDYEGMTAFLWDTFIESNCSTMDKRPLTATDIQKIKQTAVGEKAFDFTFRVKGKKLKLSKVEATYKLVLFWSSWCPHCIIELPHIKEIYETYHPLGFEIIGVSLDYGEKEYSSFLEREQLDWFNYLDPEPYESELSQAYNVTGTPKMVLVDQNLTILSKPATAEQLKSKLKELFKKP